MRTIVSVLRLPWARKRLLIEAVVLLALARLAVLALPFRWVSKVLGRQGAQTPLRDHSAHERPIRAVRSTLRKVSRHVPWTSKCLDQAITGKIMLARRGIPATIYFGVKKDDKGELDAHAWLRSGSVYVAGGQIRGRFAVINTFADDRT